MLRELSQRLSDKARTSELTTFLNPYSYLVLRSRPYLLEHFDSVCCDGILLQKLLRLAGNKVRRVSFDMTSLAPIVLDYVSRNGKTIFFVGGEPGVAKKAVDTLVCSFPNLDVKGSQCGFFSSGDDRKRFIAQLSLLNPDVVVVGMGTPLQEHFLIDLRAAGWNGCGYTCGGFLHQTSKRGIVYYPEWANRLNVRFLYRIWDEPKLLRRYLFDYPRFLIAFGWDLVVFSWGRYFGSDR